MMLWILIFLLALSSCGTSHRAVVLDADSSVISIEEKERGGGLTDKSDVVYDSIIMTVIPDTLFLPLRSDMVELAVRNNTDWPLGYGQKYHIHMLDSSGIYRLPDVKKDYADIKMAWQLMRMYVNPHSVKEDKVSLHTLLYDYKPGRYRVAKKFDIVKNGKTESERNLYAEFVIVDSIK